MNSERRLMLIHVGGTIGMAPGRQGFSPQPGFLRSQLEGMPEFRHPQLPKFELLELEPLLDSSNMTPRDWLPIAQLIRQHYDAFDGFVILHGTDTMAYTASALPLMLPGLRKPVILTGSQIPLCQIRNDARENLITAMLIAGCYHVPEVCIYFNGKLFRGCRSTKVSAHRFDAFDSPNYPLLGVAGTSIEINQNAILPLPPEVQPLRVQRIDPPNIGTLRLFPGITAEVVAHFLDQPLVGLVLEAFGSGNLPSNNRPLLQLLQSAAERGVVVVAVTQCGHGRVRFSDYETGQAMAAVGVVCGHDMTVEAALTKLFYLNSLGLPGEEIRQRVGLNLVGELTDQGEA
jgi:L-asparaginase